MKTNDRRIMPMLALLAILLRGTGPVQGTLLPGGTSFQESGGVVVGEAENYHNRITGPSLNYWKIATNEFTGGENTLIVSNARAGAYVQILPDSGLAGGGPTNPPSIEYQMSITTTGLYHLYVRWEGNGINGSTSFGSSDSMFADIAQFKDGTGGVADWYELNQALDGDFATIPWDSNGGKELNTATPANNPMTWAIDTPGLYTLRFCQREDGAAVDAWVFQLDALAAPTGDGPAESAVIPEPATNTLVLLAAALVFGHRKPPRPVPGGDA